MKGEQTMAVAMRTLKLQVVDVAVALFAPSSTDSKCREVAVLSQV